MRATDDQRLHLAAMRRRISKLQCFILLRILVKPRQRSKCERSHMDRVDEEQCEYGGMGHSLQY